MLILDVHKRLGDFVLRAKFDTMSAATALFGPSGSGKTTIVDIIAGASAVPGTLTAHEWTRLPTPASGSGTAGMPLSYAITCCVRSAIVTACSDGNAYASSSELVCSDWQPPSTAAKA